MRERRGKESDKGTAVERTTGEEVFSSSMMLGRVVPKTFEKAVEFSRKSMGP